LDKTGSTEKSVNQDTHDNSPQGLRGFFASVVKPTAIMPLANLAA